MLIGGGKTVFTGSFFEVTNSSKDLHNNTLLNGVKGTIYQPRDNLY